MSKQPEKNYSIPERFRKMENLHIVFWIGKDISWCLTWKVLAILMVIPTLTIALIIAYRTRKMKSELAHNLAVAFWIMANSLWMISEFFYFDTMIVWGDFTGKHLSLIPFIAGSIILLYYYAIQRPAEKKKEKATTVA
jgi:hypothetical protein